MPSFKPKSAKKIKFNKKTSITLDGKHKEFLNEFSKDENDRIPDLQLEKYELKELLKKDTITVEQQLEYQDKINEINETIKQIKGKKKEYFLDNSKFIFDYFENKKSISTGSATTSNNISDKNKILNSFFKIKQDDTANIINQSKTNNIVQKYLSNIDETYIDMNLKRTNKRLKPFPSHLLLIE